MTDTQRDDCRGRWPRGLWWGLLLVLLVAFGALRWRLLDTPLERDEGEYAVFAQFLMDGVPPYAQAVNMKLPGIYVIYAGVLTVFGETVRGIHLGLLVANLLGGCLAALLGRRVLSSGIGGLVAAGAFLAFTIGPRLQGPWANAEAFLLPFALGAGLFLVRALEREARTLSLVLCGLLLGSGVLVKQHAALFCIAAGLILILWHVTRPRLAWRTLLRDVGLLTGSTLVPYLVTLGVLASAGVLDRFWFWTWDYARAYTGQYGWGDMLDNLLRRGPGTLATAWPLLALSLVGLVALWVTVGRRGLAAALLILGVLSFAAISVGFVYRPHYFQLLAPFVALGCGALVAVPRGVALRRLTLLGASLAIVYVPWAERRLLFELSPSELVATVYGGNGFDGMPEVGAYLAELVPPGQRFAVIGSEPELYFYADRRPATSYVYTYALMEPQPYAMEMHGEMASEIEEHAPDVIVVVYTPTSWLQRPESETYIQKWAESYLGQERFELKGMLLFNRGKRTLVRADGVKNMRPPRAAVMLEIYGRRQR